MKKTAKTTQAMVFALVLSMTVLVPGVVWACWMPPTVSGMEITDEEPTDDAVFPDAPVVLEAGEISRADSADSSTSDCTAYGTVEVIAAGFDEAYGLQFEIQGTGPDGLEVEKNPVVFKNADHQYDIMWDDSGTREEAIDITLTAQWIDEYGREGATSDPLHIVHDGAPAEAGCSTTSTGGSSSLALVFLFGLIFMRVRKG